MKLILRLLFLLIPVFSFAQTQNSLSEILWSRVTSCYSMFEDMDDDGVPDFSEIDDSKNGYLQISGGWPTCGCSCTSTVGAYKNSTGDYTLLQSDEMNCDWARKVSSNKEMSTILPDGFGINSFASLPIVEKSDSPLFFIDFEIPHVGTDTKVKIELIPFGLFPEGEQIICFEYKQEETQKSLRGISNIAKNLTDDNTINHLLNGDFNKINSSDNKLIINEIGTDNSRFVSMQEIQKYVKKLKQIYDVYTILDTNELTLGWNRIESRFYIKEKGKKLSKTSFKEFLVENVYWGWLC